MMDSIGVYLHNIWLHYARFLATTPICFDALAPNSRAMPRKPSANERLRKIALTSVLSCTR